MRKRYCILVASMIAFLYLFFACRKDDGVMGGEESRCPIDLSGEIDQVMLSRVNDGGFCDKDVMGIYIVDYEGGKPGKLELKGNRASNVQFTYNESNNKWNGAYDIYWKDSKTPIDVFGYYPWDSPESIGEYAFEVQKDQAEAGENGNLGGYEASDFLWGKAEKVAPLTKVIRLAFRHKMSMARVTLMEGEGFAAGEWTGLKKQVLVTNTKRKALIDLNTGNVTATGMVATTGTIPYQKDGEFRAIVVPQVVSVGMELFKITIDGVVYTFEKNEVFTYVPSKMHNFTIQVNKKENTGVYEFVLVSESITAWENDEITHNAKAKEYIVIQSEAGKLKETIIAADKDFRKLQNLKIKGEINAEDFYFMRDSMNRLQALNLKDVKIADDIIPDRALEAKYSLTRLVLPDQLKQINQGAFYNCRNLTGSLIIPEGVTKIENEAFNHCQSLTGTLSLPSTLEVLGTGGGAGVFRECKFVCELKLPEKLRYIGIQAFYGCSGFYGELHLPGSLEFLGDETFGECRNLTGSLTIPQGVIDIGNAAFRGCSGLNGTLTLHDGIVSIGARAFEGTSLKGELHLPKDLVTIGENTFSGCDFSGTLVLPEGLRTIGDKAFAYNWRLMGVLEFPEGIQSIGAGAFAKCRSIEGLVFPESLENIRYEVSFGEDGGAFQDCFGIGSIVCKGSIPPYVQAGAFNGVPKDNFTLEVPEPVVKQYQITPGWSDFKRVAAHRELVCRPALATAINTECVRRLVVNAEGDWEVCELPDWCVLSQMEGSKKTELILTIKELSRGGEPREGDVVFQLKDKDYTTRCHVTQYDYEYGEDEIISLQEHKMGNGINLVFLGDGYSALEISKGVYMTMIKEQVERFFDIEPYRTYRDYFNIYTGIAVSPESGVGTINTIRYTKFETTYTGGVGLRCDYDAVFAYALKMPTVNKGNLNQTLIIVTPNSTDYGGICQMWEDGSAIAFCPLSNYGYPLDSRGVIQHEAGGHGFGKLGDEYIYHNEFIDFCGCSCCGHVKEFNFAKALGWYENLSLTGKMHEVPWAHFIFDDRYSDVVDIYEGGFMHARGVFRSEQNSCMNNDVPYYSAISREAIVKRIMEYAGESYSFEKFVENDKRGAGESLSRSADRPGVTVRGNQFAPRIHKGKPDILK